MTKQFGSTQKQKRNIQKQLLYKKYLAPDNEKPRQLPNPITSKWTVAQRRALFESNVAEQQNKKPTTTTTVIISLKKTTPGKIENMNPMADAEMSPCSTPFCTLTSPTRGGTPPKESPANAPPPMSAPLDILPQQRHLWTPPRIKNVLLKRQFFDGLVDDKKQEIPCYNDEPDKPVMSSSPIKNLVSPAGMIIILHNS